MLVYIYINCQYIKTPEKMTVRRMFFFLLQPKIRFDSGEEGWSAYL